MDIDSVAQYCIDASGLHSIGGIDRIGHIVMSGTLHFATVAINPFATNPFATVALPFSVVNPDMINGMFLG